MNFVVMTEFAKEVFQELNLKSTQEINTDIYYQLFSGINYIKYYKQHKIWMLKYKDHEYSFEDIHKGKLISICIWLKRLI